MNREYIKTLPLPGVLYLSHTLCIGVLYDLMIYEVYKELRSLHTFQLFCQLFVILVMTLFSCGFRHCNKHGGVKVGPFSSRSSMLSQAFNAFQTRLQNKKIYIIP